MNTYTHSLVSGIWFCLNYTSLFFLSDFSVQPHYLSLSDISGQGISRMMSSANFFFHIRNQCLSSCDSKKWKKGKRKLTNDLSIIPKCSLVGCPGGSIVSSQDGKRLDGSIQQKPQSAVSMLAKFKLINWSKACELYEFADLCLCWEFLFLFCPNNVYVSLKPSIFL